MMVKLGIKFGIPIPPFGLVNVGFLRSGSVNGEI